MSPEQFQEKVITKLDKLVNDTAVLKTQMQTLVGNGQPGRLAGIESRVRIHDKLLWMLLGAWVLITTLGVTALGYILK